jgi:hypothetical protein
MKKSFEEIRSEVYDQLKIMYPADGPEGCMDCYIESLYSDEVIYAVKDKMFRSSYRINADGDAELYGTPIEVEREVSYAPVFTAERLFVAFKESAENDMVIRRGKLFEAGDFPDKGVAFDEADLDRAVSSFSPVDNDLEHSSTILDGQLGQLTKIWRQGSELFGDVQLPKWLDDTIGEAAIKVSLAFDRSKNIVGNALVLKPRIEDAAIQAAFSTFSRSRPSDITKGVKPGDNKPMKLKDALKKFFSVENVTDLEQEVTLTLADDELIAPVIDEPIVPPVVAPAPVFKEDPRVSALEAELVKGKGYAFADAVITSRKALPAQREQIAAMYCQAVKADASGGSVFSAADGVVQGAQVNGLKAFFDSAPSHSLVGEAFVDDTAVLLFGDRATQAVDAARTQDLLNMTDLGRKAAEASKN